MSAPDIKSLDGKIFVFEPADAAPCFMKCFFNTLVCPCLGKPTMIQHVEEKDGALDIWGGEAKLCNGCAPMSPCPLCIYCGFGPCAAQWHFEKKEGAENTYTAKGSAFACQTCTMCTNHNGDEFVFDAAHDGSAAKPMEMKAGMNPMNPPCFVGHTVLKFYEVADRKATPIAAAAPEAQMVERD